MAGSGMILGPVFHRYSDGYRFAKLACDLVEKHGFVAYQAKSLPGDGKRCPLDAADRDRDRFHAGALSHCDRDGDLTCACYSMDQHRHSSSPARTIRSTRCGAKSEKGLDFVRKAKYRDVADIIVEPATLHRDHAGPDRDLLHLQRRAVRRGGVRGATDGGPDAHDDLLVLDPQAEGAVPVRRLRRGARGSRQGEGTALGRSRSVSSCSTTFYYAALTVAALYEKASADEQPEWRELLTAHEEQLREWAENNPPTFADKHALVSAEIARLEGRDADAMRLYEEAIRSAREHGFVQNEGLAHELAARFYAARGFETIAARLSAEAHGPAISAGGRRQGAAARATAPAPARGSGSDCRPPRPSARPSSSWMSATVVKASQAVSGEIELGKLIETLMRIAIEHAGAERGLLILLRGDEPQIVAEATAGHGRVEVTVREVAVDPSALPQSALHYVIRTQESVVLDDASVRNLYSDDEYIRQKHPRSVLCLPVVKQTKLVGALYLENNLTPYAFTSSRVAVLELLASQAAISLENARLYSEVQRENTERKRAEEDLRRSEAYLAEAQRLSRTGSFGWSVATGEIIWSDETFRIFGYDKAPSVTIDMVVQRTHPDDRAAVQQTIDRAVQRREGFLS